MFEEIFVENCMKMKEIGPSLIHKAYLVIGMPYMVIIAGNETGWAHDEDHIRLCPTSSQTRENRTACCKQILSLKILIAGSKS